MKEMDHSTGSREPNYNTSKENKVNPPKAEVIHKAIN